MAGITILPSGKRIDAAPGTVLLDVIRGAGIDLPADCGGAGACGKCRVIVRKGAVESAQQAMTDDGGVEVLACMSRLGAGDCTIEVPPAGTAGGVSGPIAAWMPESGPGPALDEDDAATRRILLRVPGPSAGDGLSDLDRLKKTVSKDFRGGTVEVPLGIVRPLAETLRAEDGAVAATAGRAAEGWRIVDLAYGGATGEIYGAAIDIGTTTIAVQVVPLSGGPAAATAADYNGQIACGLDVIGRINYARTAARRIELRARALETVNGCIREAAGQCGVRPLDICAAAVSGNTTMMHLLLGVAPEHIRREPYTPAILDIGQLTASETGIDINPEALVYFSPCVGSYVGGDITAGILCTDFTRDSGGLDLFMDIGTNGELVAGNGDYLMCCACSAGPSFEGGGIECGMRAMEGAIERVRIDPDTGAPSVGTIGGAAPRGICGSGIVSLLAELVRTGWIDPAGKLNREKKSDAIAVEGRFARYLLCAGGENGEMLAISETEITSVLRSKAAVYSACRLMMKYLGADFDALRRCFIAGGFGASLDIENAVTIGLLPDIPRHKYRYIGNSSLCGSLMVLRSMRMRKRQKELAGRMTYLELATNPEYMTEYTGALFLPHTDRERFPSVKSRQV
jgi:uncharacterized 2Fe-2S/4Fe-4S cluster protein (DUF4445 family)